MKEESMANPTATSTVLITGGSSGLGYETALSIAKSHPKDVQIVIAARTGQEAADKINAATEHLTVAWIHLDLTTHDSTRDFASRYLARGFPPISALVMNAALQLVDKVHFTDDGIETMFAVNHVNHSLLFYLLKDSLTPSARIVIVGSSGHDEKYKRFPPPTYTTGDAAAHPPSGAGHESTNQGFTRYGLSKLAQIMWAYALHDHIQAAGKRWTVTTLDPGVMLTGLYRWATGFTGLAFRWVIGGWIGRTFIADTFPTEFSAATLATLAVGDQVAGVSGKYFRVRDVAEIPSSDASYDKAKQADLWNWTLAQVAKDDAERAKFAAL